MQKRTTYSLRVIYMPYRYKNKSFGLFLHSPIRSAYVFLSFWSSAIFYFVFCFLFLLFFFIVFRSLFNDCLCVHHFFFVISSLYFHIFAFSYLKFVLIVFHFFFFSFSLYFSMCFFVFPLFTRCYLHVHCTRTQSSTYTEYCYSHLKTKLTINLFDIS